MAKCLFNQLRTDLKKQKARHCAFTVLPFPKERENTHRREVRVSWLRCSPEALASWAPADQKPQGSAVSLMQCIRPLWETEHPVVGWHEWWSAWLRGLPGRIHPGSLGLGLLFWICISLQKSLEISYYYPQSVCDGCVTSVLYQLSFWNAARWCVSLGP